MDTITVYYYIVVEQHGGRKCFAFGRKYYISHNTLIDVENVVGLKREFKRRKQIFNMTLFKRKWMLIYTSKIQYGGLQI